MSGAPVISMQEGGLWWFSNLCVPDPYLILPCMSSTTLMLLMYSTSKQMPLPNGMKRALITGLPILTFFCVKSFPAVCESKFLMINCYILQKIIIVYYL